MSRATSSLETSFSAEQLLERDAAQAEAIFQQGKETVVFVLLTLAMQVKEASQNNSADTSGNPATPSAMISPYQKSPAKSRKEKARDRSGDADSRRHTPERIDHFENHHSERLIRSVGIIRKTATATNKMPEPSS